MSSEDARHLPATHFGSYPIESFYREGGMSLLYLGTHPDSGEAVILKTLKERSRQDPDVLERFDNEAKILKLADHPNIVGLFDYGTWEGDNPFIALEFVQGQSLHTVITHRPLSLRRAVEVILEIAYALCHLHTLGVIHRDLKPENLMLTHNGAVKLIDMGIAQMLSDALDPQADEQPPYQLIGTPIYMSPEQRYHPESVSYPSDIYSLGIIAYELVLGKLSHGQIHIALMPKGLQKILARALQPRIEDRYQDVVDLITDLSAYLNSETLDHERKGGDQLSELSEHLQQAQALLIPSHAPQWRHIEIGVTNRRGLGICGLYYDFIELPEKCYGVVMVEPTARGVEGVIYTAVCRGMIRTLCRLTTEPASLIAFLNDLILRDAANQVFSLSYLVLNPSKNSYQYIACGPAHLWHLAHDASLPEKISSENPALGVKPFTEFTEITGDWHIDDTLLLHTEKLYQSSIPENALHSYDEESFAELLAATRELTPQNQTETLVRKVAPATALPLERHSLSVISIARRE